MNLSVDNHLAQSNTNFAYPYTGWLYSSKNCGVRFNSGIDAQIESNPPKSLVEGWNFVSVLPWMLNTTASSILAQCSVSKLYTWNATSQSWSGGSLTGILTNINTTAFENSYVNTSKIGSTFIVKVANDCQFGAKAGQQITMPPPIPTT